VALCPYQLKPCLLEGVYFSRRAVSFRREYFCSRFICATDWQLICSDAELRLGRWELWKLCHRSLCLRRRQGTEQGPVTETSPQDTCRRHPDTAFGGLRGISRQRLCLAQAGTSDGNVHPELTHGSVFTTCSHPARRPPRAPTPFFRSPFGIKAAGIKKTPLNKNGPNFSDTSNGN